MEGWGHSSIWALIEGKTDKQRDKEKREKNRSECLMCVYVSACVYVCVYMRGGEVAGMQFTSVQ